MPQSSPAASDWSIITSPNGGYAPTSLSDVTCVTASDCWALGRTEIGQTYANTALMRWNGTDWQVVPSPSIEKKTNGLVDITCFSSSNCWAVGFHITIATIEVDSLALHWDGTSWAIVPTPSIAGGFDALYGVDCVAESDCWAVGFENSGSQAKMLIQRWDGTVWTIQPSPDMGADHNVLNDIACLSASDCRAVGYVGPSTAKTAMTAEWNGTVWSASALPLSQPLATEENLLGITCNSAADCWAVGDSYDGASHQPLIFRGNATSWTSSISPGVALDNYLTDVACASGTDCWAVGHSSNAAADPSQFDQDLILHWDGFLWLPNAAPPELATYNSDLQGVTCASASLCWAVGTIQPSGTGRPHILQGNGTSWAEVTAPDFPAQPYNSVDSVTCVSASDCWAVGFTFYGNVARSQTMHWDGAAWEIIESPNTALERSNYTSDVDCISSDDCWAVGQSSDTINRSRQSTSMHWDGTAWSLVDTVQIDPLIAETVLTAVSCVATDDCWGVGWSVGQDYAAHIQHWTGVAWALVPAPLPSDPSARSILYDVDCVAASDCTAVGVQFTTALTGSALYQTYVTHWDGSSWSLVASPNTSSDSPNILSGLSCTSATDCWAVGSYDDYLQALFLHWNGTDWTRVDVPWEGEIVNSVTCLSETDCWAIGPYYTRNQPAQTLIMHWDGTSWTKAISPNTSTTRSNYLSGIACASSSDCWAVGQYSVQGGSNKSLTVHYAPSPPIPASVVSRKTHGTAGDFDIDLPLAGNPGIECRTGGASGDYQIVVTFPNAVTFSDATVTSGAGTVANSSGSGTTAITVNLTGVANAQTITVTLAGVGDGTITGDVGVRMAVLVGDTTANGVVNSSDIGEAKANSGQSTTSANFRTDVTVNGAVNSSDIGTIKAQSGTSLP